MIESSKSVCIFITCESNESKAELWISRKSNISIDDCFNKGKGFSDQLFAIGYPFQESDLVIHLLGGLCYEYNPCVCAINNRFDDLSIKEIKSRIFSFENLLSHQNKTNENHLMQANIVSYLSSGSKTSEYGQNVSNYSGNNFGSDN